RQHYTSLDQVPEFLREAHPHTTLAEFNREMSGKILIPQPFAKLKNLHDVQSGFGISKFMIIELVIVLLLVLVFKKYGEKIREGHPPRGKFWNTLDAFILYLRDNVARPAIGEHDADEFLPLLWTIFFFILVCNLFGMLPWVGAPTGAFGVTLALAFVIFCTSLLFGMKKFGPLGFWFNQVPHMDLPLLLRPLKLLIFFIELLGLCIKHAVLAVRLLANMVAGHLVLLGILGFIAAAAAASHGTWLTVTSVSIIGSTLFSILELFVAFLQAYVFTFLAALFIGAAVHHH
ncbi:MAG TPA: F0F1 ATP synthase subunit A, partial [Planctomycetaceae bacterium]